MPQRWLGIDHVNTEQLPSRGQSDALSIAVMAHPITERVSIIDTPDLDGDQPAHHAQADRVFRWCDAVLFLVTPEKYQMTELQPYYRLALRYGIAAIHVMNKVEEQAVVDDYQRQLEDASVVFAIPRDDAAYEAPAESRLDALRSAIGSITIQNRDEGDAVRVVDLMDRLRDQIIEPLRADRRAADELAKALRAMETPSAGIDVNPLTQQLQRRLQQRSVLYLMGPGRVLDRVRQVPGMLARLPRTTWDLLRSGKLTGNGSPDLPPDLKREQPSFRAVLIDQFAILHSRMDDAIRSTAVSRAWIERAGSDYPSSKLDPNLAGQIADDEIAKLQQWLEKQWNATPRDTAVIEKLLKVLPGGQKLTKWSEAAPYVLTIVVATHHAFFGHIDLMILGGWTLATWLTEKLSNQVASRARAANQAIAARFTELAHRQIEQTCRWLQTQAPTAKEIQNLTTSADRISEGLAQTLSPSGRALT
jgi:hypothetical protein